MHARTKRGANFLQGQQALYMLDTLQGILLYNHLYKLHNRMPLLNENYKKKLLVSQALSIISRVSCSPLSFPSDRIDVDLQTDKPHVSINSYT